MEFVGWISDSVIRHFGKLHQNKYAAPNMDEFVRRISDSNIIRHFGKLHHTELFDVISVDDAALIHPTCHVLFNVHELQKTEHLASVLGLNSS